MTTTPTTPSLPAGKPAPRRRTRTRRGNEDDHEQFRLTTLNAARALYRQGGLEAVTMRAVASHIGASPMLLYHYFADKTALMVALWDDILEEAMQCVALAVKPTDSARERLLRCTDAYLSYWELHPDNFKLVFLTDLSVSKSAKSGFHQSDTYRRIVGLSILVVSDFARELGADEKRVLLARDLRASMMAGYLHARLFNILYPWDDLDALRGATLDAIMSAVEGCLRAQA